MPNPGRHLDVGVSFSKEASSACSLPRDTGAVSGGDAVSPADGMRKYTGRWAQRTLADLCPGCADDRSEYTVSFARTEPGRLQEALGVPIQRRAVTVSQDCCP